MGNSFIIEKYCYNGIFFSSILFINDVFSEDKQIWSYQEFQNEEEFEDTKGHLESVNRRTDNKTAKINI